SPGTPTRSAGSRSSAVAPDRRRRVDHHGGRFDPTTEELLTELARRDRELDAHTAYPAQRWQEGRTNAAWPATELRERQRTTQRLRRRAQRTHPRLEQWRRRGSGRQTQIDQEANVRPSQLRPTQTPRTAA